MDYGNDIVEQRSPIVAFNIGELDSLAAGFILEEKAGVIARAGLHCAAHAHRMLGTLDQGVVRFSPSHFTSEEEIKATLLAVKRVEEELG
ncbi:aminotransferase class V-fold PLP-dependent enzyme [Desulfosporosinus burensis]